MKTFKEFFFIFMLGAVAYSFLELIYRGRTHWSMTLTGGAVLMIIYAVNAKMQPTGIVVRCLIGCMLITVIEFFVGYVVNVRLGLQVWDYGAMPYNVMGQICPQFTAVWFLLCIPADMICSYMRTELFDG